MPKSQGPYVFALNDYRELNEQTVKIHTLLACQIKYRTAWWAGSLIKNFVACQTGSELHANCGTVNNDGPIIKNFN